MIDSRILPLLNIGSCFLYVEEGGFRISLSRFIFTSLPDDVTHSVC